MPRDQCKEHAVEHADAALAEPAERVLIEPRVPVLVREVHAHASAELGRDAIGRLAERGERLPPHLAGTGEHRVDRRAKESAMPAWRGEDLDLPAVRPAAQRVWIHAEDPAGLPQRQPVTALERCRLRDTANLGESGWGRRAGKGEARAAAPC